MINGKREGEGKHGSQMLGVFPHVFNAIIHVEGLK